MTEPELSGLVSSALDDDGDAPWTGRSGTVLYSDRASIRPGRVYLMGMNPGGRDDQDPTSAIARHLTAPCGTNSYADQCWDAACEDGHDCAHCSDGRLRPERRSTFQRRVCSLFDMLGSEPKDVLSTNLIFARSPTWAELRGPRSEWKRRCRNVHDRLLDVVRPDRIITLGFGDAFSAASAFGREIRKQEAIQSNGRAVAWHREIELVDRQGKRPLGILGVAHPSHRGFARAGLADAHAYPAAIRRFITERVLNA